jgi:hypothetical protein
MFLSLLKGSTPSTNTIMWFNVGGVWKQVIVWFNVSGVWKQTTLFVKIGGGFK